jgi:hypothetical protein
VKKPSTNTTSPEKSPLLTTQKSNAFNRNP